ncbi:MAG: glycosyltransferase [Janthinobacterium lividum]
MEILPCHPDLLPLTLSFLPPQEGLQLSVVIPVRNEAEVLTRTLTALAEQVDASGNPLEPVCYEVLVLVNNCTDETAEVARCFARRVPLFALHVAETTLPAELAHVGSARRLLMDAACRRLLQCGRPQGMIASTDGDTRVAPDWVYQTLRQASHGADAIGGRIRVERHRSEDREARLFYLRDLAYQRGLARLESCLDPDPFDPWPRHHQFYGGSLAITASAYCRVGGLPVLPCLEDIALGEALRRMDARIRHSPAVRVSTSARQDGRTQMGLSSQLREWGDMGRSGHSHWVQQPAAVEARMRARHELRCRQHLSADEIDVLADELAVPCSLLHDGSTMPFGMLWAEVMACHMEPYGAWARRWPLIEITQALHELREQGRDFTKIENAPS